MPEKKSPKPSPVDVFLKSLAKRELNDSSENREEVQKAAQALLKK